MKRLSDDQLMKMYELAGNGISFENAKEQVIPKNNGKRGRKSLCDYSVLQKYVDRSQEFLNGGKINPSKLANKTYELLVREATEGQVFPSATQISNLLRNGKLNWKRPSTNGDLINSKDSLEPAQVDTITLVADDLYTLVEPVRLVECPFIELGPPVETLPDGGKIHPTDVTAKQKRSRKSK
jgi:hypothetical protein